MLRRSLLVFCMLFISSQLWSAHLIGGELSYECLGNNNYRFTLKLYRDCASMGALFDGAPGAFQDFATITIFEGNSGNNYRIVNANNPVVTTIPIAESNPCIIPPAGICVQSGVYTWIENLPTINESYTVSYQRCCRNNTISNLVNPGEVGSTYSIELTPKAQSLCNSSPEFENLPPIVICSNQDLSFDFSASDPDGDILTYELCTPLTGGGNNVVDPEALNGVAPDPESAPPYQGVPFIPNQYSASNPMGGNPPLSIDANTGLLTGVPVFLGQYVVGVCVKEYRDGELLSTVVRDFQFNVTTCQVTVDAQLNVSEIDDDGNYRIKVCGDSVTTIDNISYQLNFIDDFLWTLDLGTDTIENSTDFDPTFNLPGVGSYSGNLVLNPGLSCDDSLNFIIDVFPGLEADFEFEYDTCDYGPVTFFDLSESGAGPNTVVGWEWEFGDGENSNNQNPIHLYKIPGDLNVRLLIKDVNECENENFQTVPFYPVPDLLVLEPNRFVGCVPDSIFFLNLSVPVDSTYDINWDFGDGNIGSGVSPYHFYQDTGVFSVALDLTSPIGCKTDTFFEDLITMLPNAVAGFDYNPYEVTSFNPEVFFLDESIDAAAYYWNFNNSAFSIFESPSHTFVDTGLVTVTQIVTHESGCRDTSIVVLDVVPKVSYFLPNAFTPNLDGVHDEYKGTGITFGIQSFNMSIWNRYGELVYETDDYTRGWNGRKNNSGQESPEGVYLVFVEYYTPRNEKIEIRSYATLLR